MEVTATHIIYTNRHTTDHKWELKHLRGYGCDNNIFFFEAGSKFASHWILEKHWSFVVHI